MPPSPNPIRSFGKYIDLLVVLVAIFAIPLLSPIVADALFPFAQDVDPDRTFLWGSIHHVAQLLLTLAFMWWLHPRFRDWGFNLRSLSATLQWIGIFLLVFGALEIFSKWGGRTSALPYPLTTRNMLGVQFFQYVLSGLGEEPLFRGLVMTFLATRWKAVYRLFGIEVPQTVLIATALFMLAHVTIDPFTFSISGVDFGQQLKALQLGLLYGIAFHYTRSLIAPIAIHGLSNGFQYTLWYYFL